MSQFLQSQHKIQKRRHFWTAFCCALLPQGIDLKNRGRTKKHGRRALVSENPYLRLAVKVRRRAFQSKTIISKSS